MIEGHGEQQRRESISRGKFDSLCGENPEFAKLVETVMNNVEFILKKESDLALRVAGKDSTITTITVDFRNDRWTELRSIQTYLDKKNIRVSDYALMNAIVDRMDPNGESNFDKNIRFELLS